jgi:uncharacterized membrane protein YdbT with pleckstrin-like domain
MTYVEDNLLQGEKVLFSGKISTAVFLRPLFAFIITLFLFYTLTQIPKSANFNNGFIVFLVFVLIFCFLISTFVLLIRAIIKISTSEFAVTNKRILVKTGFVRRNTVELLLAKVESIGVDQNVLGRLLNFGTVVITGTGGTSQRVYALSDPIVIRKRLNQVLERINTQAK